jgi:hypothetical protein
MGYVGNFARLFFGSDEAAQLLTKTTTLTDANVKALPTTPIILVAAPGAGRLLIPTLTLLMLKTGASAYTNISLDGVLVTQYHGSDNVSSALVNDSRVGLTELTDFLTTTTGAMWPLTCPFQDDRGAPADWGTLAYRLGTNANANLSLDLTISNAALGVLTGGNSGNSLVTVTTYLNVSVP